MADDWLEIEAGSDLDRLKEGARQVVKNWPRRYKVRIVGTVVVIDDVAEVPPDRQKFSLLIKHR